MHGDAGADVFGQFVEIAAVGFGQDQRVGRVRCAMYGLKFRNVADARRNPPSAFDSPE